MIAHRAVTAAELRDVARRLDDLGSRIGRAVNHTHGLHALQVG